MKKIITIFLVACLLFSLAACAGTNSLNTPDPTPTPTPVPTTITVLEAQKNAKFEFNMSQSKLLQSAQERNSKVKSIGNVDLATTETEAQSDTHVICILKGTFWGYDEYGNAVGKYNFDWTINAYPTYASSDTIVVMSVLEL